MKDLIKVACVYTGMPASLVERVEQELRSALPGTNLVFASLSDPDILDGFCRGGRAAQRASARLVNLYAQAANSGADIVYNICSSVGQVADAAAPLFALMGIPFVRIDERMAKTAIEHGPRVGVIATLQSTLEPTKQLILKCASKAGREVTLVDGLEDGAFGLSAEALNECLLARAQSIADKVDCLLLAQASMASAEARIAEATGKPTFSSPRFGAMDVRDVVLKLQGQES